MVDVSVLRKQIKGIVSLPGDDGFEESLKRWAVNAERRAAVVVKATSAQDASFAVRFARENKLPLTVRGGGHSISGSSSIDGGLIVDLSQMRKVTAIPEKKQLVAQGGALISDLDRAAAEYHLATVSGTVNDTGIGGLTLGGGKGFLSGKYGCLTAGAGPNFGIVTEFTFQAYDQGNVWSGMVIYSPDKIPAVVEAAEKYRKAAPANSALAVGIGCVPGTAIPTILISPFYNGSDDDGKELFKAFFEIDAAMAMMESRPYVAQNALFLPYNPPGIRRYQKAGAVAHLTLSMVDAFCEYVTEFMEHVGIEDGHGTMMSIEFYPNEKIVAVPRDATAFYQRGNWVDWRAMIAYGQRADLDGWVVTWAQRLADKIVALEKADDGIPEESKTGGRNGYWFTGDGVERKQIFGDNYRRLRELKKKYDPDMVFHKWYPVVPAD